jgi:hypothetical protein
MPNENGEIQQSKRAQYLGHLPLPSYLRFPIELASILLLLLSLFLPRYGTVCVQNALIYQTNFTVFLYVT